MLIPLQEFNSFPFNQVISYASKFVALYLGLMLPSSRTKLQKSWLFSLCTCTNIKIRLWRIHSEYFQLIPDFNISQFLFSIIVADQEELVISHNGKNSPTCGKDIPCQTIGYTLNNRSKANDIIKIDNQYSRKDRPFFINETYSLKKNLTLMGVHGRPKISSADYPKILFRKGKSHLVSAVTLTVVNIWFDGVSLALFNQAPNYTNIRISRCIYDVPRHLLQDSPAFIDSSASPPSSSSSIIISIEGTIMYHFNIAMKLEGLHLKLEVKDSHFRSGHDVCSSVLWLYDLPSLSAKILRSTFDHVLMLEMDQEVTARSEYLSSIVITYCTLYGASEDCLTGLSISDQSNVTLMFESTSVSSDVTITGESNEATFINCIFGSFEPLTFSFEVHLSVNAFFDNCQFINNAGWSGVLQIDLGSGNNVTFYNSNFMNNTSSLGGAAVTINNGYMPFASLNGYAMFKNCSFTNNSAKRARERGGAVNVDCINTTFERCHFINNTAASGGAVGIGNLGLSSSGTFTFKTCYFEHNSAFKDLYPVGYGEGGAISISLDKGPSAVYILNCSFKANKAFIKGGAINHSAGKLFVINTSFLTSVAYGNKQLYIGGDTIYSTSTVALKNVSIGDLDSSGIQNYMVIITELYPDENTLIRCFPGKQSAVHGRFINTTNAFYRTKVSCAPCHQNKYLLSSAVLQFTNSTRSGYRVSKGNCSNCPFGGICEKGQIRAKNNFWGYEINTFEVQFINCPFGYCCSGSSCRTYNSCRPGREGILCGSCSKGLTENVMTSDCIEPTTCRHPLFWLVFSLIGFIYFLALMYWKEVINLVKIILIPKDPKFAFKRISVPANQIGLLENQSQDTAGLVNESNAVLKSDRQSATFFLGFFTIVLNFYQTNILYKVPFISSKSQSSLQIVEEMLAAIFNLQIYGLFYQEFSWCPIKNLKPVSKVLFKMSFIIYLFSLVLTAFSISRMWRCCRKRTNESKSILCRLLPSGLRLTLISYAAITSSLFSLVLCVPLHPPGKILFIDGSIECYRPWQHIVIVAIICWVILFPIGLYSSSRLLHQEKISNKTFVAFLTFPLAAILYWIYSHLLTFKQNRFAAGSTDDALMAEEGDFQENRDISRKLLNVVEGPFRKAQTMDTNNNGSKLLWESTLIGRRLILIVIKTFVTNTITRMYTMLLCTAIFLVHHMKVRPFSSNILNNVETGSLLMLTAICSLNILPAYNYIFPNFFPPFSKGILRTFARTETALTLVFPFLFGFCLSVLVCVRILQFIFWLFSMLVRMIYVCTKPKSS